MSETIRKSELRVGRFTSSDIHKLMSNGKKAGEPGTPYFTYIEEKNFERKLGRSLDDEINSKPLNWGLLVEKRVFDLLGIEYKECSQETIQHSRYDFLSGSPDGQKFSDDGDTLVEIKCPFTLKSFCTLIECIKDGLTGIEIMNEIRANHTDGDKFFWQCVCNAILTNSKYAELIIYMPYRNELDEIRVLASNMPVADLDKYYGLANSPNKDLPYLIEGKFYQNLNIIRWEVSEQDKELLTSRVLLASKSLITV